MKQTTTKRRVLASFLSLALCVSMLVGSTYAWFTDTVTSSGNIIKSGTLDVGMLWADGKEDPESDTTTWNNVEVTDTNPNPEPIFGYELWEPGYAQVRHIQVVNKGSLALKYNLTILANGEVDAVADLAEVIDVYTKTPAVQVTSRESVPTVLNRVGTLREVLNDTTVLAAATQGHLSAGEQSAVITIALKMQELAGNEYQNKQINAGFDVKLFATQWTQEEDTFDEQYDKMATYDSTKVGSNLTLAENGVKVTVPAASANVNDIFELDVTDNGINTDTDGKTTVSYEVKLKKNGVELDSADADKTEYTVEIDVGKNLEVVGVYHNGVPVLGWSYNPDTGVITFTTKSFSPFTVDYHAPKQITFNSNTGSGTMEKQNIYAGMETQLDNNTFTKTGYSFAGWATSADGKKVYDDGDSVTFIESVTLYAVWQEIKPNSITIDKTSATIKDNETLQLTANVAPDTALDTSVAWTSSNTNVAEVDSNGLVTAKTAGTATITATCNGNTSVYAECALTVEVSGINVQYMEYNETTKTFTEKTQVVPMENKVTSSTTAMSNGWYVVEGTVTVPDRMIVNGTVNLILADGATLNAQNSITVGNGKTLNIYGQSNGTGALNATGFYYYDDVEGIESCSAGIGEYFSLDQSGFGTVNIHGGRITATGGSYSAGIGGADMSSGAGTVTIYGGTITARGGYDGAGIGGGSNGDGCTVNIYNGNVTAIGGDYSSGIGGGYVGAGGTVKIYGGTVTANGGNLSVGIGAGAKRTDHGTLTVADGLTVFGGNSANPTAEIESPYSTRPQYMVVKALIQPTSVRVSAPNSTIVGVGLKKTLTATVLPNDATNKSVTWSSSNPAIATVDTQTGEVTGVSQGTVQITATTINGISATCTMMVNPVAQRTIQNNIRPSAKINLQVVEGYTWKEIANLNSSIIFVSTLSTGTTFISTHADPDYCMRAGYNAVRSGDTYNSSTAYVYN